MSLWKLSEKQTAQIAGFKSGLPDEYRRRLRELGFEENEMVSCLKLSPFRGPKTYQIGDSVFSLAEDVADKILVKS